MPRGFEIDDVLYSHVKFSKEQRRDILYTNEEDLEKQREVFKKGILIAEYVGFQIQKDQLGEVEGNFPSNRKYIVNDTDEYVTVLVGEEVDLMNKQEDFDILEKVKMLENRGVDEQVLKMQQKYINEKNFNIEELQKRMSKLEKKLESFKIEEEREYLNVDFDFGEETLVEVIGRVEQISEYCIINKNKKREEYEDKVFNGMIRFVHKWKEIVDEEIIAQ